jgi:hypothetical protein
MNFWKEFGGGTIGNNTSTLAVKPYWVPLVENNAGRIARDLGFCICPTMSEEEARLLYIAWLDKTDYPAPTQKLEVNCVVEPSPEMSKNFTRSYKPTPRFYFSPMVYSEKKLWVYNVSRVDHQFDHPMLGNVTIPANTTRKRYSMWTSFPEYVMGTNYNFDTNEMYTYPIKGDYFVNDLINPDCITPGWSSTSVGRDLSIRGVFWSYSNPPKPAEVNAAVKKMKAHYTDLMEKMAVLYETFPKDKLGRAVADLISPEHHSAAEYLKVTTPWHPVLRG